jgi:hypothetical protein
MSDAFSISSRQLSSSSASELRTEINGHTRSDSETASILRSIARFGGDTTIWSYEVSPRLGRATRIGANRVTWSVRAVRD